MIVRIFSAGKSFKGLGQYLTHDAGAETTERVAWTHTLNCANDHIPSAIHEMFNTYLDAGLLKEEAGIRKGGRPLENPVKHFSLNWHPDETPDRAQIVEAVEGYLTHMGWQEHQAVLATHTDKAHAHVHVMLNAVHPETGAKLDDGLERRRSSDWAAEYEREHGRIYCEQRLAPVEEREPAPTRPAWGAMKEAERAQQRVDAARMAAEQAREAAEPPVMSNAEQWQALKAEQRAARTAFFEDGRDAFRSLRNTVFQEVRNEFRDEWAAWHAARRDGLDGEALQSLKDDLVARQDALLKERRDSACNELREARAATYQELLQMQQEERGELRARQTVSTNAYAEMRFDAANANQPPSPAADGLTDPFHAAARETTQPPEPPSQQPSRSAITASPVDHAYGPPDRPDPRVRDGADIVAGIGLGMAGGAATLVERLFDGFLGGAPTRPAPAPEQDNRPDPSTTQRFRTAAAEARQQAEREQEAQARDDWWDERRSRARD